MSNNIYNKDYYSSWIEVTGYTNFEKSTLGTYSASARVRIDKQHNGKCYVDYTMYIFDIFDPNLLPWENIETSVRNIYAIILGLVQIAGGGSDFKITGQKHYREEIN